MLRRLITAISSVGSHKQGMRATGTPEEHQVAELVAAEMRSIGLSGVALEPVPVHSWRFRDAALRIAGGRRYACSSMAGSPRTRKGGITAELVWVGDGRRDRLERLDLKGKIALVDWRVSGISIGEIGLELGRRGAAAVVMTSLEGGARFQGPDALGTGVSQWHAQAPPLAVIPKEQAHEVIERCTRRPTRATVIVDVEVSRRARGRNVVGVFGQDLPGAPIVVGAHHDGWFSGAFDNASGVAAVLTIAKGLMESGWQPSRPVWFCSHTAEEFGIMDDAAPWCVGAWQQVTAAHPRWGTTVPFYLDIEASGRSEFPLLVLGPVELRRFATRYCRMAKDAGMMPPRGWRFQKSSTGTHQYPFQLAGVPALSVFNWHTDFQHTDYHTINDTIERLDFGHLENLCRLDAALLVAAERDADGLLDFRARAREVERVAQNAPERVRLTRAAKRYGASGTRARFAKFARSGIALDAHGETGYLWEQAQRDADRLDEALKALKAGDRRAAVRAASRVGSNSLARWVSHDVQKTSEQRALSAKGSWSEKSHLTRTPDLWAELASMRGERGARPFGPWVAKSLERHRTRMRAEAKRRAGRVAAALGG